MSPRIRYKKANVQEACMDTDNGATDNLENVGDAVGDGTSCANCVTAGHGCTCASLPAPAAFMAACDR